ncbi:DHA2 family efflux MFS transporter permease subunit [Acidovorax cavernicola]|uniref:DHA2 family efflux MFS transporter permease subunit n=1 Tax=Acidovorax cavernicola TaxID=1675792 RepID=A0A9X8D538_9BURK|nr:DHA2 family efflux MFS transporter permease subunit [Acidovorax cavernicola]RIX79879.1 DHA2 family efflux MFS transporter permease subunit [Acidovorax cavernicola]
MTSPQTPDTPPSMGVLRARYGERYRWYLLLSVMVGTMASIMSSTIVNVAIPDMSHHFALGQERAQWVSSGFMVAMTVSMLTTPWLLSRYGYRRTYVGTMLLLLAGGIVGGVANLYPLVLLARVAEGLAAGVVQPIPAIIILRAFEPHEQGRASGIFGMGVVLAPAIGPSIGGVLVDLFGWRSIFFMVVPFCLASIWLAYKFVPKTAPGGVAATRGSGLDARGLALGTVGTLCLLNGLVELRGDSPLQAALLLTGALVAFAAFVWWQRRLTASGGAPLMNLALFRYRQFAMGSLVAFIYGTALFGSTYLLPVYMQVGLHLSASHVGTTLLPAGIVLAFTIAGVGRLADKQPTWLLVSIGLALLAVSFALMAVLRLDSPLWLLVMFAIVGRIGLGFILPSLNLGSMRPLAKPLIPQGASAISFVRMLGGAVGVSLCAIILEWRLAAHGDSLTNAVSTPARLAAFDEVFLMLAGLCALAVCAAWQLREKPDEETAQHRG